MEQPSKKGGPRPFSSLRRRATAIASELGDSDSTTTDACTCAWPRPIPSHQADGVEPGLADSWPWAGTAAQEHLDTLKARIHAQNFVLLLLAAHVSGRHARERESWGAGGGHTNLIIRERREFSRLECTAMAERDCQLVENL